MGEPTVYKDLHSFSTQFPNLYPAPYAPGFASAPPHDEYVGEPSDVSSISGNELQDPPETMGPEIKLGLKARFFRWFRRESQQEQNEKCAALAGQIAMLTKERDTWKERAKSEGKRARINHVAYSDEKARADNAEEVVKVTEKANLEERRKVQNLEARVKLLVESNSSFNQIAESELLKSKDQQIEELEKRYRVYVEMATAVSADIDNLTKVKDDFVSANKALSHASAKQLEEISSLQDKIAVLEVELRRVQKDNVLLWNKIETSSKRESRVWNSLSEMNQFLRRQIPASHEDIDKILKKAKSEVSKREKATKE